MLVSGEKVLVLKVTQDAVDEVRFAVSCYLEYLCDRQIVKDFVDNFWRHIFEIADNGGRRVSVDRHDALVFKEVPILIL
jgi:hypothetical protein